MTNAKPRLLPETAEIALTEIKRTFESRISDALRLRRVSAPLYLPASSGLCSGEGVRLTVDSPQGPEEVEIVTALDKWCRSKLADYDISPGFGLFTVANALLPRAKATALSSPHLDGWAWEMAIRPAEATAERLAEVARALYTCVADAQHTITLKFPHLPPLLPDARPSVDASEAPSPDALEALVSQKGCVLLLGADHRRADVDRWPLSGRFLGWNNLISKAVDFGHIGVRVDGDTLRSQAAEAGYPQMLSLPFQQAVAAGEMPQSVGGFISRKHLAMLLLHQVAIQ